MKRGAVALDLVRARYWPWLGGGFGAAFVLVLLHPRLLLTSSIPSGFDLSGHIYPMSVAVHELIPRGTIHGWDLGWFAGFPIFYFYFPLPALLAALLTPVLGFLPAAKVVSALGSVILPLMLAWLVCQGGAGGVVGLGAVLVGSSFLLMQSHSWLGGNIASGLAGEFSYAIGFALSLAYLASLPAERGSARTGFVLPAVLLAATALSHVVCVTAAVLGSLPLLRKANARQLVLCSWVLGFALAAFWALPFLVRLQPVETHRIVQRSLIAVFHPELLPLLPLAVGGVLWARRHASRLLLLLVPSAAALLLYVMPSGPLHPGRMLPYFFLAIHVFAGVGAGRVALWVIQTRTVRSAAAALLVAALLALPETTRDFTRLYGWAGWAYSGLKANSRWPELHRLLEELRRLPPGRVYWQDNPATFAAHGSRQLFTLLPYWLPEHAALRGLWAESSPLSETLNAIDGELATAYADPNPVSSADRYAKVLAELSGLGTRYFITLDRRGAEIMTRTAIGTPLATAGNFAIFGLPAVPWVTASGQPHAVSDLEVEDTRIRFRTTAQGVPHTIRIGHFANWKASGAAGLVRVPPNFMSVRPTQSEVVLRFRPTSVELMGTSVSLAAVVWLVWLGVRAILNRSSRRKAGTV